jgi:YebC/PmpR family DNA-binding regulatory protein
MAGHSKWANIKHRKGAQDKKRAKIFTRILKEISIAARNGGGDPDANPALRLAISNAKGANMPKDNIERAIKKATGADADNYEEVTYEGYAPNGVAVFVEATTDNINRTVAAVRSVFTKGGGSLGTNGSLSFLFDRKGVFTIPQGELDEDGFTLQMIDSGAEDVILDDGFFTVYTSFEDFAGMQKKLEELSIEPESSELQRIPHDCVSLPLDQAKTALSLIEAMEEDDDVSAVYHNLEMTEELVNSED